MPSFGSCPTEVGDNVVTHVDEYSVHGTMIRRESSNNIPGQNSGIYKRHLLIVIGNDW